METLKFYPKRFNVNHVKAIVNWTPQFLSQIQRKFGIRGEFTCSEVEELFEKVLSRDATRMKFWRLYKTGKFKRTLKNIDGKEVYVYSFTESAKRYHLYYGGFENPEGPLMKNKLE